jgi:hypothetical protein
MWCRVALLRTDVSEELIAWWWRWYFPRKRRFLQEPDGVTSQNTAFVIEKYWRLSQSTRHFENCGSKGWVSEYEYQVFDINIAQPKSWKKRKCICPEFMENSGFTIGHFIPTCQLPTHHMTLWVSDKTHEGNVIYKPMTNCLSHLDFDTENCLNIISTPNWEFTYFSYSTLRRF